MIVVPLDSVDTMVMTLISLKILSRISLGAKMDLTFFGTNKEQ